MKQVNLTPHRLGDKIVRDSILAVNTLEKERDIKGKIAGGMAVESYIAKDLHRRTIDLDIGMPWQGNVTEFKRFTEPLVENLKDKDYDVNIKKKGKSFDIILSRDSDSFMIQHPKFSRSFYERIKPTIEREVSNRRRITRRNLSYSVLSPEDLVGTKLHRALIFSNKYNLTTPSSLSAGQLRKKSQSLREQIIPNFPEVSPVDIAKLRMINDCYDVKALSETVGLNNNYFSEVIDYWQDKRISSKDLYSLMEKLEIFLD